MSKPPSAQTLRARWEAERAYARSYYQKHRLAIAERKKRRHQDDPSAKRASNRAWYVKNRAQILAKHKEYQSKNKDRRNARVRARYAARKAAASGTTCS